MVRYFFLIVTGALFFGGCDSNSSSPSTNSEQPKKVTMDDVKRDAAKSLETTAKFTEQNKENLMKDLKEQLAVMDSKITDLRSKGAQLANDARAKWELKMAELETRRQTASAKLVEVENSTAQAWDEVEKGAKAAWEELKKAFQNAANEF